MSAFPVMAHECVAGTCSHTDGRHMYNRSRQCESGECTHAKKNLHCGELVPWLPPAADTTGKDTGTPGASTPPTRNQGQVVDLLADVLRDNCITRAITGVEVIRGERGMALCLIVTFADGDQWTVSTMRHHREPSDVSEVLREAGGQQLAEGVTYLSGDHPFRNYPWGH